MRGLELVSGGFRPTGIDRFAGSFSTVLNSFQKQAWITMIGCAEAGIFIGLPELKTDIIP